MSVFNGKKLTAVISVILIICLNILPFSAFAVPVESKGSITLNVIYNETGEPVSNVVFRLYRFADATVKDDKVTYTYTDSFSSCRMDMGNLTDAYLPVHIVNFANEQGIDFIEKTTDEKGNIVFSDLSCGAYAVVAGSLKADFLKPSPFIVAMPMNIDSANDWVYDILASPKVEVKHGGDTKKTYMSVKKQWQGSEIHPEEVTVTLLKDGDAVESVRLNEGNKWYHRWDNLDSQHAWSVVESAVPEGYTVSYEVSQMTVIITNTGTYTPEEPSAPTDTTDTTKPVAPEDTTKPKPTSPQESTTEPDKLVQTGQLNWPVPVFSISGLVLFSIGWAMLNLGKKDEEAV